MQMVKTYNENKERGRLTEANVFFAELVAQHEHRRQIDLPQRGLRLDGVGVRVEQQRGLQPGAVVRPGLLHAHAFREVAALQIICKASVSVLSFVTICDSNK